MKRQRVFLIPHPAVGVTPSIKFSSTHLYTWVERGTVGAKCLVQEHNAVSQSGLEARTRNPEMSTLTDINTVPPTVTQIFSNY